LHLATRRIKEIYSKETSRKVAYGNRETKRHEDKRDKEKCETKEVQPKHATSNKLNTAYFTLFICALELVNSLHIR
jgi:hypothetical protein